MQTTFANGLNPAFYGKQIRSGVPAYDNNGGIRTLGGFISDSNTDSVKFGTPIFAAAATPNAFMGKYNGSTAPLFRGWLLNRNFVNEYSPAHADYLLNGQPADVLYHGAIWITVPEGLTPTVGAALYVDSSTGELTTTASSNIDLHSVIKEVTAESGTSYMLLMVEA